MEVIPEYVKTTYRAKVDAHIESCATRTRAAGMDYQLSSPTNLSTRRCANI